MRKAAQKETRRNGGRLIRIPRSAFRTPHSPQLPFVFINISMTADGKIATANRAVASFGSRRDQEHLLALRATADAVMCGARTADLNNISLGPGPAKYRRVRLSRGLAEYNLRVIVSGAGSVAPRAAVFQRHFSPIIILTTARAPASRLRRLQSVADEVCVCGESEIDFRSALAWLRAQWGVKRLLCEGGGELNAALLAAGLVNELHLTICPLVFGGSAAPTIAEGVGVKRLADALRLSLKSRRRLGDEFFLVFAVLPAEGGRPGAPAALRPGFVAPGRSGPPVRP